jgi:hypothetical protein
MIFTDSYLIRVRNMDLSGLLLGHNERLYSKYTEAQELAKDLLGNPKNKRTESRLLKLTRELNLGKIN